MQKTTHNPTPWLQGFGLNHGVEVKGGERTLYLSGQTASDAEGAPLHPGDMVAQYNLDPRTTDVAAGMFLVKDFGELYTDDFQLSMEVQNAFEGGLSGCQWVRLFILYDGGAVGIPLAKKGCSSNFDLMAFGAYLDGKKNDLSDFGVDFTDFVTLNCTAKEGNFEIRINDEQVYTMQLPDIVEKIRGFSIHFEGAGTLKNVELGSTSGVVYTTTTGAPKS